MSEENNNYKFKIIKFLKSRLINLCDCVNILIFMIKSKLKGVEQLLWLLRYHQEDMGGYHSYLEKKPLDNSNKPIPWYTYSAIEYLRQLDFSNSDIFEYGSGNSSNYWARNALTITSVESDKNWYEQVNSHLLENQKLYLFMDKSEYVKSINMDNNNYDIIVIDGKFRYNCAVECIKRLNKGGIIILDNSDWFPNTTRFLRKIGFFQIDFVGPGPINSYSWSTSIFMKDKPNINRKNKGSIKVTSGLVQEAGSDRSL